MNFLQNVSLQLCVDRKIRVDHRYQLQIDVLKVKHQKLSKLVTRIEIYKSYISHHLILNLNQDIIQIVLTNAGPFIIGSKN